MTTTPTATISTDIAELGGVTGASIERDALFAFEVFMEAPKKDGKSMQDAFMAGVAWSAAPVAPEPAAAQEPSWAVQFYETEAENIELWLAQVLEEAEFDKNELVTVNRAKLRTIAENVLIFAKAALAPQPLAEVSAAQAVPGCFIQFNGPALQSYGMHITCNEWGARTARPLAQPTTREA